MATYIAIPLRIITASRLQPETVSGRKKEREAGREREMRERSISELSAELKFPA